MAVPVKATPATGRGIAVWPFTRPLTDLHLIFLSLPLLWLMGLEQILPMFLLIWAFLKLVLIKRKVVVPLTAVLFLVFILWQLVAAASIEPGSNWIVFGRNLMSYVSGLLTFLIVVNDTRDGSDVRRTIMVILVLAAVATLVGLAFVVGIIPPEFNALIVSNILPGGIRQSQFIQENIILREIGRPNAVLGAIKYPRVSSIFLFPNEAGIAFMILLSWVWFAFRLNKGRLKGLLFVLLLLASLIFLLIMARVGIGAFVLAIVLVLTLSWQHTLKFPVFFAPLLLVIFILVAVFIGILKPSTTSVLNSFFFDLRANSFVDRLEVYQATADLWLERPFTGWGTPREVTSVNLAPAGTHGEYLATLFRFGLIGLVIYLLTIISIWAKIICQIKLADQIPSPEVLKYFLTITTIFLALNILAVAYGLYFDLSVVILVWTTIALGYTKIDPVKQFVSSP